MMNGESHLDSTSSSLVVTLSQTHDGISWATLVVQIYQQIQDIYKAAIGHSNPVQSALDLVEKTRELERCMTLNLVRHIALRNGSTPYYLGRVGEQLAKAKRHLEECLNSELGHCHRDLDHLCAELQCTFTEHGFCNSVEIVFDVEEANKRLGIISTKLSAVEKQAPDQVPASPQQDIGVLVVELHSVMSELNGIRQALTEENMERIRPAFDKLNRRIKALENTITKSTMVPDSEVLMRYLAGQHLLRKSFVSSIYRSESQEVITEHVIHPRTRAWILERLERWLYKSEKQVFAVSGGEGAGKTAFSSALCKLHHQDVVASHFLNSRNPQSCMVNGIIQSLSSHMCYTLPDYLNHLDDEYGDNNNNLRSQLNADWRRTYQILLQQPIRELYTKGKSSPTRRRKLLVLDGIDRITRDQADDLQRFLTLFVKDFPKEFCLFLTVRSEAYSKLVPNFDMDDIDAIMFENRMWMNRHIKDIEIYISSSLGAILSGEDETELPNHAKVDEMTLQNAVDELLQCSAGRFDFAMQLMSAFAQHMSSSGQFLGSLKKAIAPLREAHGQRFEQSKSEFASPFRSYRDKEGRSVDVRVMRQSHYLMDKSRVALIRGRLKYD